MAFTPFVETDRPTMNNFNEKFSELNDDLAGKAPGGYGLGQTAPEVAENIDTIERTGLYLSLPGNPTQGTFPSTNVQGNSMILHLAYSWSEYAYQYYYLLESTSGRVYRGCVLCRTFDGSTTPGPWEWVNPPMQPGVEFRTTERYNGKPVYVQTRQFGSVAENTNTSISFASGVDKVLRYSGNAILSAYDNQSVALPWNYSETNYIRLSAQRYEDSAIRAFIYSTYLISEAYVQVWYTKTTD